MGKSLEDLRAIGRAARADENRNNLRQTGKFKLGDTVKVIARTEIPHYLNIGEVGIIERIDRCGFCQVTVYPAAGYSQWVAPCDLELWEE